MKSRSRATRWAVGVSVAVLALGSSLPIWTVDIPNTPEEVAQGMTRLRYEERPLWATIPNFRSLFGDIYEGRNNLIYTVVLFGLSFGAGWLTFRAASRREVPDVARDFAESPGGALPDGRAGPTS